MIKKVNKLIVALIGVFILFLAITPISAQNTPAEFTPPVDGAEGYVNQAQNAAAHGAVTFLQVEGYTPWAALTINAGNPEGVDLVTVSFDDETDTLTIEIQDSNHTNHASILVNKEFADKYIADSEGNLNISTTDAVNYQGMDNSNTSAGGGAVYVFHIDHFSTQYIYMSSLPGNDFEPPVDGGEAFTKEAQNAAANGAVTFLRVEGYEPWAALVINAGDPHGVDAVTVDFDKEEDTLIIKAQDSNTTNHVSILVNKKFADKYIAESEGDLKIDTSDAVNYQGLNNSNESAGGGAVYVFHIEHFSTQSIKISAEEEAPFPGFAVVLLASAVPVAYYAYKKKKR